VQQFERQCLRARRGQHLPQRLRQARREAAAADEHGALALGRVDSGKQVLGISVACRRTSSCGANALPTAKLVAGRAVRDLLQEVADQVAHRRQPQDQQQGADVAQRRGVGA
jgi:hypothetical protein